MIWILHAKLLPGQQPTLRDGVVINRGRRTVIEGKELFDRRRHEESLRAPGNKNPHCHAVQSPTILQFHIRPYSVNST